MSLKIIHVLTSEKAVAGIEKENKITFIVDAKATKPEIKAEVEREYGEKVKSVNTHCMPNGKKKAVVAFTNKGAAQSLAAKLKVI